jgi:HSP20 family protein
VNEPRDIGHLHQQLEELVEDLWRVPHFIRPRRGFRPAVDLFRTEDPLELNVVVELAGVDSESVHVVVSDRTLLVAGERPRPHSQCARSYYHLELQYGSFERRITFSESVDVRGARASYEHGLLTIVLPVVKRPASGKKASIPVRRQP